MKCTYSVSLGVSNLYTILDNPQEATKKSWTSDWQQCSDLYTSMLDQNNTDVVAHPHVGSPGSQKCNGYSNSFAIHPSWTQQELHQLKLTQKIWQLDTKCFQINGHYWKCSQELGNFLQSIAVLVNIQVCSIDQNKCLEIQNLSVSLVFKSVLCSFEYSKFSSPFPPWSSNFKKGRPFINVSFHENLRLPPLPQHHPPPSRKFHRT